MLPSTKSVLGPREFGRMKPTACVINLARGPIWDEKALYSALKEGKIAGAGSDVFEVEPASKAHPLLEFDNFVCTPHMAAHTEEALKRMSRVAVDVVRVLDGKKGLFVSMPQEQGKDNKWYDQVVCKSAGVFEEISDRVLAHYKKTAQA